MISNYELYALLTILILFIIAGGLLYAYLNQYKDIDGNGDIKNG